MTQQTTLPLQIDIVSDVVCPFCILGYRQLQVALDRVGHLFDVDIRWHPFELNPQMAPEGEELRAHLARKMGPRPDGGQAVRDRLQQMGAAVGFEFDYFEGMRVANTFAAHQLLHWAREFDRETDLKLALFSAYFRERRDINDRATLVEIAGAVGLDREAADAVLEDQRYAEAVRQEERHWQERDVMAVPAFFFDGTYPVPGAQDPQTFERVLRKIYEVKNAVP